MVDCVNIYFSQLIDNYVFSTFFSIDLKVWGYPTRFPDISLTHISPRILPRPDTSLMDTFPTRQIPDGHFPDQTNAQRTFPRPNKCPTNTSLTRCIPQRTFSRLVKYTRFFSKQLVYKQLYSILKND